MGFGAGEDEELEFFVNAEKAVEEVTEPVEREEVLRGRREVLEAISDVRLEGFQVQSLTFHDWIDELMSF